MKEPGPLITNSSWESHNLIFHWAGEGQKLFGLQSCGSPAEIPSGSECTHRDVSIPQLCNCLLEQIKSPNKIYWSPLQGG